MKRFVPFQKMLPAFPARTCPSPAMRRAFERLQRQRAIWADTPTTNDVSRQRRRWMARKGRR